MVVYVSHRHFTLCWILGACLQKQTSPKVLFTLPFYLFLGGRVIAHWLVLYRILKLLSLNFARQGWGSLFVGFRGCGLTERKRVLGCSYE